MNFLIVDDSDTRLAQLRTILTGMGQEVAGIAHDGIEALRRYEEIRPDAVIMDLIMPRMNGLDALRAMLRIDPNARIVMASSMRSPESALECQRNGARYYLHKPYEPAVIRGIVEKLAQEIDGHAAAAAAPPAPGSAPRR